jgi:hypothetical protein
MTKAKKPEELLEPLTKAYGELYRKRRIKRQVIGERQFSDVPPIPAETRLIPIEIAPESLHVHHNATAEDLRAVLALLPPSAVEGVHSIRMLLGKEMADRHDGRVDVERDPFTGRLSAERMPGVYAGACLGVYLPKSGKIELYASVYDPSQLVIPLAVCEIYLKVQVLRTLVHEVAHHHDHRNRVRRGRWLADRKNNVEYYAENTEYEWTRQFVVPYVQKAYPTEVAALLDFVENRGGIRLPFEDFAGDPRTTCRDGCIRLLCSTAIAFESWVDELPKCQTQTASRLAFAWELHYADNYDACFQVLERILAERPGFLEALVCKGDTLIHLDRYDEAFAIAENVLAIDPTHSAAWEIRGDVFEGRQTWQALLDNCDRWALQMPKEAEAHWRIAQHRAIAFCGLGDLMQMEQWISVWAGFGKRQLRVEFVRKFAYLRAGKEMPKN